MTQKYAWLGWRLKEWAEPGYGAGALFDPYVLTAAIKPSAIYLEWPYEIFCGRNSLSHSLKECIVHFHHERNPQGLDNIIPFPSKTVGNVSGKIRTKYRLGGLLKYYYRQAA